MRLLHLLSLVALGAGPVLAADEAEVLRLWQALQMDGVITIMQAEGEQYGRDLDRDILGGSGGPGFAQAIAVIYDAGLMRDRALSGFTSELATTDVAPMIAFFESDLGRRIIGLELSAREALLDPDIEAASRETAAAMEADGDPRMAGLDRFIEVNDLVESNLMGALNASYAFYLGLGQAAEARGEQDILTDVWAQEDALRADTEQWVYGFLALAYQPLSDAELDAYTAFSGTAAGQDMNRAIFAAFDGMFVDISRALGGTVGRFMVAEEL